MMTANVKKIPIQNGKSNKARGEDELMMNIH